MPTSGTIVISNFLWFYRLLGIIIIIKFFKDFINEITIKIGDTQDSHEVLDSSHLYL